jgi:hypothetical protein
MKAFLNGEVLITKLDFFEKKAKRQNSENRRNKAEGKSSKEKAAHSGVSAWENI